MQDIFLSLIHILFVLLAFVSIQAMFGTKWKTSFEKLFLPMIIVLGFLYLLIIPIMVVPDEYVHIYTAYDMSDVMMGTHDAETVMMRQADNEHTVSYTHLDVYKRQGQWLVTNGN